MNEFRLLTGHDYICNLSFIRDVTYSCVLCYSKKFMETVHLAGCSALNNMDCLMEEYCSISLPNNLMINDEVFVKSIIYKEKFRLHCEKPPIVLDLYN